jgi:predicted peptidase
MFRKCCLLSVLLLVSLGLLQVSAQDQVKTGFVNKVYKDGEDKEHKYYVFIPADYKGDKEYPIILFLHGKGDTGAKGGLAPAIRKRAKDKPFPFIAVFPSSDKGWTAKGDGKRAIAILDEVCKEYKVDSKRTYLTGLSMGGFGTWTLAAAFPDRWAAIVPICGGGSPATAEKIKNIPCWCFHGDADKTVPVENSRKMIKALEAAGAKPKYTEYPGVDHNSWDRAYGTAELYEWMLQQSLK